VWRVSFLVAVSRARVGGSEIRAVLFDLDGTLVDSLQGIAATLDGVLVRFGAPACDRAALRSLVGAPLETIFSRLLSGRHRPSDGSIAGAVSVDDCVQAYLSLYPSLGVPAAPLFDGIRETLESCRVAGLNLALVTSKRMALAQAVLRFTGIESYFDVVIGADSTDHHKPHPAPALAAVEQLGVTPADAVVVGDAVYDMQMARAAGCRAVGVAWGYGDEAALRQAGAEALATTPASLTGLLLS
jgi:phosphoglycolate phosphatase